MVLLGGTGDCFALNKNEGLKRYTTPFLQTKAEHLRSEALQLVKKATLQDLTTAITELKQSAALFRAAHLPAAAAADYLSIGEIYSTWSRYKPALQIYLLALSLSRKTDYNLRCSILSRMAITYVTAGNIQQALLYAKQASAIADQGTSPKARAEADDALGLAFLYSKNPEQGLDRLRSAQETFKNLGDMDAQAAVSRHAGWALASLGSAKEALIEHTNALRLWMSTGNIYGVAQADAALGLLRAFMGQTDQALVELEQATQTFHNLGDRDSEAVVLNERAWISEQLGDYETSLRYFSQAWHIFAAVGDEFGAMGAIDGAARARLHLHEYAQAELLYRIKLSRAQRAHHYHNEAAAFANLADVAQIQHQYRKAETLYLRSIELSRSARDVWDEIGILISLGRLYVKTRQYEKAEHSLHDALRLEESNDEAAREAQVHYELATMYQSLHKYDVAKTESEAAIHIIESQRTKVSDFESRATYFASVHEYYQLYIDILMQLDREHPNQGFAQRAFEAAEKSKVRSLLDMLASSAAESQCPSAAAQTENSGSQTGDCGVPAPLALTLEQVQAEIRGDNAILLEYALAPDASYLWAVEDGRISSFRLPGEKEISALARAYRKALTDHQPISGEDAARQAQRVGHADEALDSLSRQLSQVLLGPAAHLLDGKRLIVVPDGLLRYIPFTALQLPSARGEKSTQTLTEQFEVVILPSASTLNLLREASAKRPPASKLARVFADPVFETDDPRVAKRPHGKTPARQTALTAALRDVAVGSSRIPRLGATGPEADAIKEALSGKADVARDFAANRDAVLSGDLGQYRYIHFATHGLLDSKHPEFSGLILSLVNQDGKPEEGYVRVRDIYGLKLSADLVVLSSCNSALGKDVESEGIIGLTRAFLFAGSRRVISSLWKVDDDATKELMTLFYSELHAGKTAAAALRSAQSTLARDPYWKSPYYWAAFILQGEYK
jgi:CHAT domain-containing protein/tetratricopeptide (TPR) repeat protein